MEILSSTDSALIAMNVVFAIIDYSPYKEDRSPSGMRLTDHKRHAFVLTGKLWVSEHLTPKRIRHRADPCV